MPNIVMGWRSRGMAGTLMGWRSREMAGTLLDVGVLLGTCVVNSVQGASYDEWITPTWAAYAICGGEGMQL